MKLNTLALALFLLTCAISSPAPDVIPLTKSFRKLPLNPGMLTIYNNCNDTLYLQAIGPDQD